MSAQQGFRISWASESSASGNFANVIKMTEAVCTPFAIRQYQLLGLLPPVDTHPRVLDNACGSGRQAEVLQQAYADAEKPIDITCCDISPGMISSVERRIKEGKWNNVKALVVNAEELDFPAKSFTHAFMSFGIMFPSETDKVLSKMFNALESGAKVSFTFWKKSGIWAIMHKAAICATSDPTIPPPKFYHPSWNHSETLITHLEHAGFKDIKVMDQNIPWEVESKSYFVKFAIETPMWQEYIKSWTQEQKDKLVDCAMEVLDEEYPDAGHGSIEIPMIAWIGVARKP